MKGIKRKNLRIQINIFLWHIKSNLLAYMFLIAIFLILLPICSIVWKQNLVLDNYVLIYGYLVYITTICMSILCVIPLFMYLHSVYHLNVGECIKLMPGWKEKYQCRLWYLVQAFILSVLMLMFGIVYNKGISKIDVIKDYISLLVIVWVLYAGTRFLTCLSKNVYFIFMIIELYNIICSILRVGSNCIWNIYSLQSLDGIIWIIDVVLYICCGIAMEIIADILYRVSKG